ncbi:MAG TPA: hypothetical protein VGG39_25705 [Polyangiaceae bacterium]
MRAPTRRVRTRDLALVAFFALVFGAGPTVGDVGSCGDQATALAESTFAAQRKAMDCQRCTQCGITTQTCTNACNPSKPSDVAWPSTCYPLEHDGIVCLDALQAASCSTYASFVSDVDPAIPSECDFCHVIPEAGVLVGEP